MPNIIARTRPFLRTAMWLCSVFCTCWADSAIGQPRRVGGDKWPTETLFLSDGQVLQGLVENDSAKAIEFIEVRRPAGKPMFLIVHPIERARVTKIERLGDEDRQVLRKRLLAYRNRARIESRRADAVELRSKKVGDTIGWEYDTGEWFHLTTTLEESIARRLVVRLEQIFSAYRQVLTPRRSEPLSLLTVVVYGTRAEYSQALREEGIAIRNPAFFEPNKNRVCAGCALNELLHDAQKAREEDVATLRQFETWDRQFVAELEERDNSLREQGMSSADRARIATALRRKWTRQQRESRQAIVLSQRRNRNLIEQETDTLLRLLFHESLHAYLANAVFSGNRYDVPSWLNEGLAQVFEFARIEADVMRVDAPDPSRLRQLQMELSRNDRLTLFQLLAADSQMFIAGHGSDGTDADRRYLFAWGLAYYLAFEKSLLGTSEMDAYVAQTSLAMPADRRFERLVGESVVEFELAWIDAMLAMKAPPKK